VAGQGADILTLKGDLSACVGQQTGEAAHQGALARPVGADDRCDPLRPGRQGDTLQDLHLAIASCQIGDQKGWGHTGASRGSAIPK